MSIPFIDKSNYLKGLLIIARKDKKLADSEKKIISGIAESLGFAKDFYEEVLHNLLANKYIDEQPLKFSDKKIAESFVLDGLRLIYSDEYVEANEIDWLRKVAEENSIDEKWFNERLTSFKNNVKAAKTDFALLSII